MDSAVSDAPTASTGAPNYDTADEAASGACSDFQTLMYDFESNPPSSDPAKLIADGAQVQISADEAAQDETGTEYDQLASDADALATYLNQPDFPENGNVDGAPVTAMQNDCP